MKNVTIRGKHKLADLWEQKPYTVLDQPCADIPVYRVRMEDGTGRIRTLHRNLLLPIGSIPLQETLQPRLLHKRPNAGTSLEASDYSDEDSSSDEDNGNQVNFDLTGAGNLTTGLTIEDKGIESPDEFESNIVADTPIIPFDVPHIRDEYSQDTNSEGTDDTVSKAGSVPPVRPPRTRRRPAWQRTGDFLLFPGTRGFVVF